MTLEDDRLILSISHMIKVISPSNPGLSHQQKQTFRDVGGIPQRKRERQTDRQRDRQIEIDRDRETERYRCVCICTKHKTF